MDPNILLELFEDMSKEELLNILSENIGYKAFFSGMISEMLLKRELSTYSELTSIKKQKDVSKSERGDFLIEYKNQFYIVELKKLTNVKIDYINDSYTGSIDLKRFPTLINNQKISAVPRDFFNVLAILVINSYKDYKFYFLDGKRIFSNAKCGKDYYTSSLLINTRTSPFLSSNIVEVLDNMD